MTKDFLKILFFYFYSSATFGQTKDTVYKYDICVEKKLKLGKAYETSEIIKRREEKIPYISGIVGDLHFTERPFSIVILSETKHDSIIKQMETDTNGVFSFDNLKPGTFNIKVISIGFVAQKMTNVSLTATQMHNLVFKLGDGPGFVEMTISSKKRLNRRQLNKKIQEIYEKINK